jgi:predicted nucleic acid-binding protein
MDAQGRPVIVHLDTSVLVAALLPNGASREPLRALVRAGDKPTTSTIVLYEWLRGPRTAAELELRHAVLPDEQIVAFGMDEAARAAHLYRALARTRSREADIAIAACAIERGAALWTLNVNDFKDIPDLKLYAP